MKRKKAYIDYLALAALLLLTLVCLLSVTLSSNQASLSAPIPLTFSGEYSYDGEIWLPLSGDAELSALRGDVILRGHLDTEIGEGACLNYYRNHIGVNLHINGEQWAQDAISECASLGVDLMSSMCGREWDSILLPDITPEDELEIHLYNPHAHGNGTAYRDFLNTLCIGPDPAKTELLKRNLERYGQPSRILGGLFCIVGVMLLGEALFAVVLRASVSRKLLNLGLVTSFTGGFFLFDTIDLCFWSHLVAWNTYARQICMMLAVFCLGYCICSVLSGKILRIARAAVLASGLLDAILIALSFTGAVVIYDTYFYWAVSQWLLCPLFAASCLAQLCRTGRKKALVLISWLLLCFSILLDIAGVGSSILSHGTCSKGLFCLIFVVFVFLAVKRILSDYQASDRVQKMEQELQESRISLMLSQLQPHFLFNVLNSIYYLCGKEPETARKMIDKFSTYLRNNLDSLDQKTLIPFQQEFDHIQTYLELEKLRFDEELTVVYDIQADTFSLPVLTVQPLVENAVKHGITQKRGGGVLTLATRAEPNCYVITIADTGVGFYPEHYMDDGKTHIGIQNVRQRLEHMVGGTLEITSTPGVGTIATIIIPRKEDIKA
ncbi:MAG: histidine kinase [Clostridiales bacterium]|nr:histidine kinase [Clostridiales bacterium]